MANKSPPSAVSVWVEGFALCVRIPNSHTLMLPLNKLDASGLNIGYEVFLNILREREKGRGPIGTKFAPVQYDVEKAVRDFHKRPKAKPKARPGTASQRDLASDVVARLIGRKV